jgi:hypothetical protein
MTAPLSGEISSGWLSTASAMREVAHLLSLAGAAGSVPSLFFSSFRAGRQLGWVGSAQYLPAQDPSWCQSHRPCARCRSARRAVFRSVSSAFARPEDLHPRRTTHWRQARLIGSSKKPGASKRPAATIANCHSRTGSSTERPNHACSIIETLRASSSAPVTLKR